MLTESGNYIAKIQINSRKITNSVRYVNITELKSTYNVNPPSHPLVYRFLCFVH